MAAGTEEPPQVGRDPDQVDAEAPNDEAVLDALGFDSDPDRDPQPDPEPEDTESDGIPSKKEMWQQMQQMQETMKHQQQIIETQSERIEELEAQVDDVEQQASTTEQMREQWEAGELYGEAGEEIIRKLADVPSASNVTEALANQLFFSIVREQRVDNPVDSQQVIGWLDLGDSANPSVKSKRIMQRLVEFREEGFFVGSIEMEKHRGKNAIWVRSETDQ